MSVSVNVGVSVGVDVLTCALKQKIISAFVAVAYHKRKQGDILCMPSPPLLFKSIVVVSIEVNSSVLPRIKK